LFVAHQYFHRRLVFSFAILITPMVVVKLGFRSLKNDIFIFFAVSLKPRLIKKLVTVQEA
jgi:hypothetical protein